MIPSHRAIQVFSLGQGYLEELEYVKGEINLMEQAFYPLFFTVYMEQYRNGHEESPLKGEDPCMDFL